MAENTTEGAISPVQPVEAKKSWFTKLSKPSLPLPGFLKRTPRPEVAVVPEPVAKAGDFVPEEAPIEQGVVPLNAMAAEIPAVAPLPPIASVDSIAQDVQKDFAAQMAPSVVSTPPETHSAQIDQAPAGLNDQTKDSAIGMAAISNSFPGTGMAAPEMTTGFTAPTNPPTETVSTPSITTGTESVVPTPISTEVSAAPSAPEEQKKELAA